MLPSYTRRNKASKFHSICYSFFISVIFGLTHSGVFVNSALKIECHIVKNDLVHSKYFNLYSMKTKIFGLKIKGIMIKAYVVKIGMKLNQNHMSV